MSYAQIGIALTIAGAVTSFCFPTVANAIIGSVPLKEAGVASGANSTIRELGGVFGVAVLATVFARPGSTPRPPGLSTALPTLCGWRSASPRSV